MSTKALLPLSDDELAKLPRLSPIQAAAVLGLDRATVYRLCRERKIRHYRVGTGEGRISFSMADLKAYLKTCVVEAGEPTGTLADLGQLEHIKLGPARPDRKRGRPARPSSA